MKRSTATSRRVAVAFHDPLLIGSTIAVLRTVPLLEDRGWEFTFWVPGEGPAQQYVRDRGYPVAGVVRPLASGLRALREPPGLPRRIAATPGYLSAYRSFLKSASPSLVHSNSLYSFPEALTASALRFPTVLHLHDMAPTSRKASIARAIARWGVNDCFAVSASCARSYAHGSWSPLVVHGAGPVPEAAAEVRDQPRPFRVGTVGVIAQRKGSDLFVEAAHRLRSRRNDVQFEMIGSATDPLDRNWAAGVLENARRVGVRHRPAADVESSMRSWDVFVLPSRRDPFPLVMLEAMGLGLPVVGTRVDGIPEQISDDVGLLVEPDDPEALAAAIERVLGMSREGRAKLGSAARDRVRTRFNLRALAEATDAVYERTLRASS